MRTVRLTHVVLSSAFKDAVRKGLLARNPAELSSPPSAKSTQAAESAWWTPSELKVFLDLTEDDPLAAIWRCSCLDLVCERRSVWPPVERSGSGNAACLTVSVEITVVRSPSVPDNGMVFTERPKTDGGRRIIDIDPETVTVGASGRPRPRRGGSRCWLG